MRKKVKTSTKIKLFLYALAAFAVFAGLCALYDRFLLPSAELVCESEAVTYINRCIGEAFAQAADENGIKTSDLLIYERNRDGRVVFAGADTAAVNALCADTARKLSEMLNKQADNVIYIKSGAFTGLSMLSETGFDVPVRIRNTGDARADCRTEVSGVGINNVSFRLYITVSARAAAYNPLLNREITVTRRILLADAVYSGEVPDTLFSGT